MKTWTETTEYASVRILIDNRVDPDAELSFTGDFLPGGDCQALAYSQVTEKGVVPSVWTVSGLRLDVTIFEEGIEESERYAAEDGEPAPAITLLAD